MQEPIEAHIRDDHTFSVANGDDASAKPWKSTSAGAIARNQWLHDDAMASPS